MKVLLCTRERGLQSRLYEYKRIGDYSMIKTGGRRKIFITKANAAIVNITAAQPLL
jgi:hypothetical protein